MNKKILVLILAVLFSMIYSSKLVYAGEGGASGGGGYPGCGDDSWTISTCYGATWRWYPTNSNSVYINGWPSWDTENAYRKAGYITGCASAGGYWRYAMVAYNITPWNTRQYPDGGGQIHNGDQVGLIGISGNWGSEFNSIWLDGQMNYIGNRADWDRVAAEYEKAQKDYPSEFTLGFRRGSTLSWFCAENPNQTLYSSSSVTVNPGSFSADTGIKEEETSSETDTIYVKAGDKKTVSFAHNIYAKSSVKSVDWKVNKSFKKDDAIFNIGTGTGGVDEGQADITTSFQNHGDIKYISTKSPQYGDEYADVTFNQTGAYKFCETIRVKNKPMTGVCANIVVPYNFINTSTIKLKGTKLSSTGEEVAFSGEQITVDEAKIIVGKKQNNAVGANYATRVDDAKIALVIYTTNNPSYSARENYVGARLCDAINNKQNCYDTLTSNEYKTKNLNVEANTEGTIEDAELTGSYNNYDVPAGNYVCAASAVYPYASGSDTNMDKNGSGSWYISEPSCLKIAKKPNFQVLGGSLYSTGNIKLSSAEKSVISDIYGYSLNNKNNTTAFSSFVELNINSPNGAIYGLASGASTGYYHAGNPRTPDPRLGGSLEGSPTNFCIRSPLTLPNKECNASTQYAGTDTPATTDIVSLHRPKDKELIIASLPNLNNATYERLNGDYDLIIPTLGEGETRVIQAENSTVNIKSNINYTENQLSSISSIPKLIIYAKNIVIDCAVNHIDAVLIADGKIDTCKEDINSLNNSSPLEIRGVTISNTLSLNRTYGAATGVNSIVPAEVINYDSSLYLWGLNQSGANSSDRMVVTYQKELAPRY